jgi:hypothetical protein
LDLHDANLAGLTVPDTLDLSGFTSLNFSDAINIPPKLIECALATASGKLNLTGADLAGVTVPDTLGRFTSLNFFGATNIPPKLIEKARLDGHLK